MTTLLVDVEAVKAASPLVEVVGEHVKLRLAGQEFVLNNTAEPALQFPAEKSFAFPVWSGLLTPEHRRRMGSAIWVFLWFVDRVTTDVDGWGLVLRGKPVKDGEIGRCLGLHETVVRDMRRKLAREKYIDATRTPYGHRFRVRNSRKFGIWGEKRPTENSHSLPRDRGKSVGPDRRESVETKKTMQLDHAVTPIPVSDAFETFWKTYPKKVGKQDVIRAWRKIPTTEVPAVLAGVERYKLSDGWKRDGGQYIPHPAKFLNGRRWEDEIPTSVPSMGTKPNIPTAADLRPKER